MKENNNTFINSKNKSWIKPIYTLFVVAMPAILIWIFFSNDVFGFISPIAYWAKILISIGFIIVTTSITLILIYVKLLDINTLSFVVPVGFCFMAIFLTEPLVPWARALIVIPLMFLVIPLNILCRKIEIKLKIRNDIKNKFSKDKIVGSK